ncbi:putative bifunctional diguanylate cyclase/phosphodiesterase [Rhodocyclus tenuis]|uniref:putative bifunctional diguanylate cyclase/phosphodiesterase n=1 Tax=Rhodocyclus tenuis TaxID=1066 RepID=UPI001902CD38|nr:EAL domain-containing protein [Rhodocyclus tenuis]MBK1679871.1 hypothetical protein [Rhodocyclus tenuis]
MSASPVGLTSGLSRYQLRWVLAGGLCFIIYATSLVWMTYQAQLQRQEASFVSTRLEAEKRAAALAYFLEERSNDVADLASSTEVLTYFANEALGMSLEYGLRANLLGILGRMNRLQQGKHLAGKAIYRRLALIDADGSILAATDRLLEQQPALLPRPWRTGPRIAGNGDIVFSAAVRHNERVIGEVVAWISATEMQQNLLPGNGNASTSLLMLSGAQGQLLSSPIELPAAATAMLTNLPVGEWQEWPAGRLAAGLPALLVNSIPIGTDAFRLVTLVQVDELPHQGISKNFLMAAAIVPLLVIIGLAVLARLYRANRELMQQTEDVSREKDELHVRYSDLEREIQRREEVEKRLREQRQLLEEQTVALGKSMAETQYLAEYDSLTKLSNRMFFRESLRRAMIRSARDQTRLALLFIDLDHFKRINDTLGHTAGDALLQETARRLENSIRETDLIGHQRPESDYRLARQGGDEFTIFLADLSDPLTAGSVAERLVEQMKQPVTIDTHEIVVTASIGISIFPDDGSEVDTLLKNADVAMYSAKASGRNQYRFFEPAMQANAMRRLALENDMRQGLARRQFVLHYQPQVDASSGEIRSFEALMRWQHPERGLIPPADFIPVAEETGLILPLTELAIRQCCEDIPRWKERFGTDIRIAINISVRVIELADFAQLLGRALSDSGVSPALIEVEITESVLMEGGEKTRQLLKQLRTLGVRVAIDDFGTGYSSLAYLKALPIDVLKIDRSFVADVCNDLNSATLARTIIAMAHNLGLTVVAEGVETEAQRDFMRTEHCEILQGHLLGRPMPQEQVIELLATKAGAETVS